MALDPTLAEVLACPGCKGELTYTAEPEQLTCSHCHLCFAVEDGIPILLMDEATEFEVN